MLKIRKNRQPEKYNLEEFANTGKILKIRKNTLKFWKILCRPKRNDPRFILERKFAKIHKIRKNTLETPEKIKSQKM